MNKKTAFFILLALTSTKTFCAVPPTAKLPFATKYALFVAGMFLLKSHLEFYTKINILETRITEIQRTQ